MQIFKLANQVKQMDVLHKYKEFDSEESLLNWLQDVLEQKEEGFDIEDDDTREIHGNEKKRTERERDYIPIWRNIKRKSAFSNLIDFYWSHYRSNCYKKIWLAVSIRARNTSWNNKSITLR
jgi:hypothetical protein